MTEAGSIATFFKKLAHFFRFVRKIRVITAQTSDSKKLRTGNEIFDMGWLGYRALSDLLRSLIVSRAPRQMLSIA